MSKTYNNECFEVKEKIETTMQLFTQAVENRETYIFEKVENMRQSKINELNQYMNTLRGMLAGLSYISELIIHSKDSDGINLFMIKEKDKYEVNLFSTMFKNMQFQERDGSSMSSLPSIAQSPASSEPSTSAASTSATASNSFYELDESVVTSRFISDILHTRENISPTESIYSGESIRDDIELPSISGMPNSLGAIGCEFARIRKNKSKQQRTYKTDNVSGLPSRSY
ncbi:unnamed protein product [Diatraea saccharalis]|uniref:Uncharacterized protein n=1 Tax=Diatraea saccharalis TaxID=40085 RepID=A0A9P1B9K2_9NEOP|nr:unnamed protein product [Diatraea saccharalis]